VIRLHLGFLGWASVLLASSSPGQAQTPILQSEAWTEDATGLLHHKATGIDLPKTLAGFPRVRVGAGDNEDVTAVYSAPDESPITASISRKSNRSGRGLKDRVLAFGRAAPTAFVFAMGPFDIAATPALHAWKGVFKIGVGRDTRMDYLYFADLGAWAVEVHAILQSPKNEAQEAGFDAFVRALPWQQVLAANGDCTGTTCRRPDFDLFQHHLGAFIVGPPIASMMRFKPAVESTLPVVASTDIPIFGNARIRRSADDLLVYVTEVEGFPAYRLVRLPDLLHPLFAEGYGRLSTDKPLFGVLIRIGKDNLMPRFFSGEPTPEAFGAAVKVLVEREGAADPFISVAAAAEMLPD
jgi:hypothetical protein